MFHFRVHKSRLQVHIPMNPVPILPSYFFGAVSILSSRLFQGDRLCGLVGRVLGYRSGSPGSIPGTTNKKNVVGLERGPLSLVSTTEELLDRKVAAPV
jgi:hypothetical protein